jgi:ABC-type multidrug transport system fused ATPase/permease subunit
VAPRIALIYDVISKLTTDHLLYRNLSFTYQGSTEPTLRNLSFSLQPGETLAIVGCNGSGMLFFLQTKALFSLFNVFFA